MLPKAHLTLHFRMSSFRWVITPLRLSGHEDLFVQFFCVFCHLFLISSASVRSIPLLSFFVPIFAWNVPSVSLSFLKRSLTFPILFFPSISLHWSLRKAFYLSSLFFGTLPSNGYTFPFPLSLYFSSFLSYLYLLFSFYAMIYTATISCSSCGSLQIDAHFYPNP